MSKPIINKFKLWGSTSRGIKSSIFGNTKSSVKNREDIPDILVANKINRGDKLQELRLKYYPSINVDKSKLYAGSIPGNLEDAENRLVEMGFRNNPTAYVEVTEEHGPDDGSYSKQFITEDGGRLDLPQITPQPAYWKRLKEQYHVVIYELEDKVDLLCHKELSAWLQPARHVWRGDASARIGVRDFRNIWFDHFDQELNGKSKVMWATTH